MSTPKRKPLNKDILKLNSKKQKLSTMISDISISIPDNAYMSSNEISEDVNQTVSLFQDIQFTDLFKDRYKMKPAIVADEMFPEGAGPYMDMEEAGGSTGLLMDLSANEKAVHAEFFNDFEDLYDDDDLQ